MLFLLVFTSLMSLDWSKGLLAQYEDPLFPIIYSFFNKANALRFVRKRGE